MAVETAADRAALLDVAAFGVDATYAVAGQAAIDVAGIFDNPTGRDHSAGPGMQANAPQFWMRTADIPDGARAGVNSGDRLTIDGTAWIPVGFDHDGTGMSVVRLRKTTEG